VIFANGIIVDHQSVRSQLKANDLLIAADGGTEHCKVIGVRPDIVIGDMDSISPQLMEEFQRYKTKFIHYEKDKDQTDLELALSYAYQNSVDEVVFYGIFGGRLDLSLANILLLARDDWKSISIVVVNGPDTAFFLRDNDSISIIGNPQDIISLIPLSEEVEGVTTKGLRWQLMETVLFQGNTRSVSNELTSSSAHIRIKKGKLLIVHRSIPNEGFEE
jgi:thiamine pyrophosphokinase